MSEKLVVVVFTHVHAVKVILSLSDMPCHLVHHMLVILSQAAVTP